MSRTLNRVQMPITYPRLYLEFARDRGVDPQLVLQRAGLPDLALLDRTESISLEEHLRLISAVLEMTGDESLGFELGLRVPLTAHGSLGYALMCCGTLNEAIGLIQRFWALRGRGLQLVYLRQDDWHQFEISFETPLPAPLKHVIFNFVLTSLYQGLIFLAGPIREAVEIWFEHDEPADFHRFRDRLPPVRFGMPLTLTRMRGEDLLHRPLRLANPEALRLAIAQCEREYALVNQHQDDLPARARTLLTLGPEGYPGPEEIARQLCVSPRTFRRRLRMGGTSYAELLTEAKRRDALRLLEDSGLPIQRVAELLGYTSPANFTRAFRAWTGRTPRDFRAERLNHRD